MQRAPAPRATTVQQLEAYAVVTFDKILSQPLNLSQLSYEGKKDLINAFMRVYIKSQNVEKVETLINELEDTVDLGTRHLLDPDIFKLAIDVRKKNKRKAAKYPDQRLKYEQSKKIYRLLQPYTSYYREKFSSDSEIEIKSTHGRN